MWLEHYRTFWNTRLAALENVPPDNHHGLGIAHVVRVFGPSLITPTGRVVPTQWVAEQHVMEDFGRIPTVADFLRCLTAEPWMARGARKLSKEFMEAS